MKENQIMGNGGAGSRRFKDLLDRERKDMAWLVHVVSALYDEMSGGRISNPMTYPSELVGVFHERLEEARGEGRSEAESVLRELVECVNALENRSIRSVGEFHVWAEERMLTEARDRAAAFIKVVPIRAGEL